MTPLEIFSAVGGCSGVLGLLGAAVGYGKLQQRLVTVERDVQGFRQLAEQVARIDERTRATASDVKDVKDAVSDLTRNLLYDRAPPGPSSRSRA